MAPKRRLLKSTSPSISASSDDDASAFHVVERATNTKSPLAMAPLRQGSDDERGAGDEIYSPGASGENGVLIRRQPPPKKMVVAKNEASPETPPLKRKVDKSPSRKKTRKAAAPGSSPRLMSNVAAAQLSRSPSPENPATAAASGAAKSPPPKKAAVSEATKSPTPKKAAARTEVAGQADETMNVAPSLEVQAPAGEEILPQVQDGEYDAEKHFKEKSQRYWYLWHMVLTLEAEHFLSFKGAFLKIDDTKARILNTKIKKLYVKQMKQHVWWKATEKDVTKVLIDLIK